MFWVNPKHAQKNTPQGGGTPAINMRDTHEMVLKMLWRKMRDDARDDMRDDMRYTQYHRDATSETYWTRER